MPTVADALRRAEKLFPSQEAVNCGGTRLDYATFASRCRRLSLGLKGLGVEPGDRVATLMLNCHRYLEAYFAVPGMGAVLVPLNNRHAVAELRAILSDAGARVLITDSAHSEQAAELRSTTPDLLVIENYEEILDDSDDFELGAGVDPEDVAGLFYTSGTTGVAKGVMLSHANLTANALHAGLAFGLQAEDAYLHAAPMFHLADCMCTFAVTWVGGRHAVVPRFEPGAVLGAVSDARVTILVLVPTMIRALVDDPTIESRDLSSLRLVVHGGAPTSSDLCREAVKALGGSFAQVYGMTEAAPLLAINPREETLGDDRLASAGREVVGVEIDIRRADGTPCAPGEVGEIVARGPNIMVGYWNKPTQTAEVLREGWYRTGDLAYRDDDHYIYIVDRAKDMIITGGENVYSAEVEQVVCSHPSVFEAAVIGIPDETWGERVHAIVSLKPGAPPVSAEQLRQYCKEVIAGYKAPASVEFLDALPKSGSGKILKSELRRPYWEQHKKGVN